MNVDGGTTVTPNASAEVDGVGMTVERLIAAPNVVRVELRIDGEPGPGGWSPIGEIRHNGRVVPFVMSSVALEGTISLMTGAGAGDPSGHWTVSFSSAASPDPGAPPQGPWIIEFDVP